MTASALDQSRIWYSACNEDGASEIAGLRPAGKRILTITASGSRAFDLLLADPAEIVAIDQNPAQTALAETFLAAYRTLDYSEFCIVAGIVPEGPRSTLLDRLIPHLNEVSREFWRCNPGLASNGLLYCGRWEGFLRSFRQWAGPRRRRLADRLLACPDVTSQSVLWREEWDDWQWRLFLRMLSWRALWKWGLREPGIAYVPRDFDMEAYARARFEHAAHHLHLAKLPFAWLLLAGAYRADVLPPYLTEQGHALIRQRADRISFASMSLEEALAGAGDASFDGASLSDYSSYSDTAAQRAVWEQLARVIAPGGRVVERKFFNKTGMGLPRELGFEREGETERQLDHDDGAWFYTFVVASREGAA